MSKILVGNLRMIACDHVNYEYSTEWEAANKIEEQAAQLQQYKLYEVMIVGATAQAREFGAGVVAVDSLMKFREALHEALEEVK